MKAACQTQFQLQQRQAVAKASCSRGLPIPLASQLYLGEPDDCTPNSKQELGATKLLKPLAGPLNGSARLSRCPCLPSPPSPYTTYMSTNNTLLFHSFSFCTSRSMAFQFLSFSPLLPLFALFASLFVFDSSFCLSAFSLLLSFALVGRLSRPCP